MTGEKTRLKAVLQTITDLTFAVFIDFKHAIRHLRNAVVLAHVFESVLTKLVAQPWFVVNSQNAGS